MHLRYSRTICGWTLQFDMHMLHVICSLTYAMETYAEFDCKDNLWWNQGFAYQNRSVPDRTRTRPSRTMTKYFKFSNLELDWLHRFGWRMLESKCVGDNFDMLVTVLAVFVTNIAYLSQLPSGTNIQKMSPISKFRYQHQKIVTNIYVATIGPQKKFDLVQIQY